MADKNILDALLDSIEGTVRPEVWKKHRETLEEIDLTKVDLSNKELRGMDLSDANLSGASFENADLSNATLSGATLTYANLRRVNLSGTDCESVDMSGCNLESANLVEASFDGANMQNSRLSGSYIAGCSFLDTILRGADLRNAEVKFSSISTADLTGVDVAETKFTGMHIPEDILAALKNVEDALFFTKDLQRVNITGRTHIPVDEDHEDLFYEEDASKILGVKLDATLDEIERAYKKRVTEYHPDKVVRLGEKIRIVAAREFERIQQAYISLSRHRSKHFISLDENGIDLFTQKSLSEVTVEEYLRLMKKHPDNDKIAYNLGIKYTEIGLLEMAARAYEKALEINPDNEFAQYNLRIVRLLKALGE